MVRATRFAALVTVLGLAPSACTAERAAPGPAPVSVVPTDPPPTDPPATDPPAPDGATPSGDRARTLLVSGILDPDGTAMLRLNPAVVVPGEARPPAPGTRGLFVVEVTYVDGSSSRVPFDALIAADDEAGTTEHGFFEVSVPVEGEIAAVRIVGADGRSTIAEIPIDEIDQ